MKNKIKNIFVPSTKISIVCSLVFMGAAVGISATSNEAIAARTPLKICDPSKPELYKPNHYSCKKPLAFLGPNEPFSPTEIENFTLESFGDMTQEQLDGLYSKLKSGPIPYGDTNGKVVLASDGAKLLTSVLNVPLNMIEYIGEFVWRGKSFYTRGKNGEKGVTPLTRKSGVYTMLKNKVRVPWFKGGRGFLFLHSVFSAIGIPDEELTRLDDHERDYYPDKEARHWGMNPELYYLLMPAKIYCGQSILDSRRESVILDYAYGNDEEHPIWDSYNVAPSINKLATKKGLYIRDEIRLVNTKDNLGLYLGRAYINRIFMINFALKETVRTGKKGDERDRVTVDAEVRKGRDQQPCYAGSESVYAKAVAKAARGAGRLPGR